MAAREPAAETRRIAPLHPLHWAARNGPLVLIGGLVVGVAVPPLASALRPWLPQLVAGLLFVSVLRMEPVSVMGALRRMPRALLPVLGLQLLLPLTALGLGHMVGLSGTPALLALVLMLAAPSIVGSPNICMMMGAAPDHALRLMVTGTALLPLTAIPVFRAMPGVGETGDVLAACARLAAVIFVATLAAVAVRRLAFPRPSPDALRSMEGASALALAVFVIGLMEAVTEGARADPGRFVLWLVLAFGANFGAQVLTWFLSRRRLPHDEATALSVIAGNRNISLYFVSLPPEVIAPLLVFIGCYQTPMYLTPLVMRGLYRKEL